MVLFFSDCVVAIVFDIWFSLSIVDIMGSLVLLSIVLMVIILGWNNTKSLSFAYN